MTSRERSMSFAEWLSKNILKLTTAVFVVALVAIAVVSVTEVYKSSDTGAKSALNNGKLVIEKALAGIEAETEVFAMAINGRASTSQQALLSVTGKMLQTDSTILACAVAFEPYACDPNLRLCMPISLYYGGHLFSVIARDEEYDYTCQDWYQIAKLTKKPHWNEPQYDSYSGESRMITSFCRPILDDSGEFIGVIKMDVSIDWLADVVNSYRPYESAVTIVASRAGTFITHRDADKILNETIFSDAIASGNVKSINKCREVMDGKIGSAMYPLNGNMVYATYAPLENGWRIVGMCSFRDFFYTARRINVVLFFIALLGLILLYISCRRTVSRLTKPITEMAYAASNMSRGNFNATIPAAHSRDEIKQLELSMRYLQRTVTSYISELKETTSTKERIESELNIARDIQMAFLPHNFPKNDKYDVYASVTPAKEVGGDLYDVRMGENSNTLYFCVGDVSGKGVPAAMFMALTKSSFSFVRGMNLGSNGTMDKINTAFAENNETGMFVTLFLGKVHLDTMMMEFCNGGHNPIIIIEPDGTARYLKVKPNCAVGVFEGFPYQNESLQLQRGCRIIAYTDGVTEAEDKAKNLYGEDRLLEFASNIPADMTSQEVVDGILASVREFTAGNAQNDDITILSIKF